MATEEHASTTRPTVDDIPLDELLVSDQELWAEGPPWPVFQRLVGGTGTDTLFGGAGFDQVRYNGGSAAVTINLATGVGSGGNAEGDRFNGVYLTTGASHRYRLDDATIIGCAPNAVAINYTKFASEGRPVR